MFIEMDAIKDVLIGNQNGKILKIVPLSKETVNRHLRTLIFINYNFLLQFGKMSSFHFGHDFRLFKSTIVYHFYFNVFPIPILSIVTIFLAFSN